VRAHRVGDALGQRAIDREKMDTHHVSASPRQRH
jgi:hypothetical protein